MKVFKVIGLIVLIVFSVSLQAAKYDKKVDPTEHYEKATNHLKNEEYRKALRVLGKYTKYKPKDADGWNLYAFTQRKLKNYKKAEANYEKALELDPENKIALEYQGELFLQYKNVEKAKANLKLLERICGVNCEEYKDLKKAIEDFN